MLILCTRILNQICLGHLKPVVISKNVPKALVYDVPFRCLPFDIDLFMHMNNASYVRCAELARWRIFSQSEIYQLSKKRGIVGLVVSQQATYLKQLPIFTPYVIRTKLTTSENKWLHYHQTFQSSVHDDAKVYATVDVKAVLKEKNGKTVRMTDLAQESDFYKHLL
jgi:acyl-CoA thioesterase FadM